MLGTRDEDGSLVAVQLTVDLKPSLPSMFLSLNLVEVQKCVFMFLSLIYQYCLEPDFLIYYLEPS